MARLFRQVQTKENPKYPDRPVVELYTIANWEMAPSIVEFDGALEINISVQATSRTDYELSLTEQEFLDVYAAYMDFKKNQKST